MQTILCLLHQLDEIYYTDLASYEQLWQEVCQQVERLFPGFSLAHAEVYTEGQERIVTGGMHHVLLPIESSVTK